MTVEHIAGIDNYLADDLSHDRLFSPAIQSASAPKTPILLQLLELLLETESTRSSQAWIQPFTDIVTSA